MTTVFHSFSVGGIPSKGQLFVMDAIKWAPEGFFAWIVDKGQSPGMTQLRENRMYVHEVAAKLIDERRRELKDGISREDILSLFGSSFFSTANHGIWRCIKFFSQGKRRPATGLAASR